MAFITWEEFGRFIRVLEWGRRDLLN